MLYRAERPRKRPLVFFYIHVTAAIRSADLGRDRPRLRSTSGAGEPNCRLRLSIPRREGLHLIREEVPMEEELPRFIPMEVSVLLFDLVRPRERDGFPGHAR